jgi:[FeFe] hydrogenase H-cluster maturation GTPase HydF
MEQTPYANRTALVLAGRRNAGKSSLLNALTGHETALTSPVAGTTTDPVVKASELYPLGPVLYIDTAGLDDEGELGRLRIQKSREAFNRADAFLYLFSAAQTSFKKDLPYIRQLKSYKKPIFFILTAIDAFKKYKPLQKRLQKITGSPVYAVSSASGAGLKTLKEALTQELAGDEPPMIGHTLPKGSLVMLVMPQDIQAPKGRLILPQVQVLRELLDYKHRIMAVTFDEFTESLALLNRLPDLVVTDSQLFPQLKGLIPATVPLTSFSILMAGRKGDLNYFNDSLNHLKTLTERDKVLILEACSHHALKNDIAREQIPALLRETFGSGLTVDVFSGVALPDNIHAYAFIVQCGSCMLNRSQSMNRLNKLKSSRIPVTNFGLLLQYLSDKQA